MNDTTVEAKLVERRLPKIGARTFPFGLSWGEAAAMLGAGVVLVGIMLTHTDAGTMLAMFVALVILAAVFLVPLNRVGERAIHIAPRYARFAARVTAGQIDVHYREREGRHYTHRTIPDDTPMSVHLGDRMWLSSFPHAGQQVALIVEGGTKLRPWKASHTVAVQVSGHDQLLLESVDYQERIVRLWNGALDTFHKKTLGITAMQHLMISRPRRQDEGAHWPHAAIEAQQNAELADRYQRIQLLFDATDTDRTMYFALRCGGTIGSWLKARHNGSSRAGVEEHFSGVLTKLPTVLRQASLTMIGIVSDRQMGDLLRVAVDPTAAPHVGYRDSDSDTHPVPVQVAPIVDWEVHRSHLIVNDRYTITYRTVAWPDRLRGPTFINAALANFPGSLRVAVPMAPDDPKSSKYAARAGMTNAAAKADRKAGTGTVTTAEELQHDAQAPQRDVEMAAGHAATKLTAYFTVDAEDLAAARHLGAELATQLDQHGVDIQPCYAYQDVAFSYTLPGLCRGII